MFSQFFFLSKFFPLNEFFFPQILKIVNEIPIKVNLSTNVIKYENSQVIVTVHAQGPYAEEHGCLNVKELERVSNRCCQHFGHKLKTL